MASKTKKGKKVARKTRKTAAKKPAPKTAAAKTVERAIDLLRSWSPSRYSSR